MIVYFHCLPNEYGTDKITKAFIIKPHTILKAKLLLEVKLTERKAALLKQNSKEEKEILPFVAQYQPLVSLIKEALMKKWNLIQNQPLPCQNLKEPHKVLFL